MKKPTLALLLGAASLYLITFTQAAPPPPILYYLTSAPASTQALDPDLLNARLLAAAKDQSPDINWQDLSSLQPEIFDLGTQWLYKFQPPKNQAASIPIFIIDKSTLKVVMTSIFETPPPENSRHVLFQASTQKTQFIYDGYVPDTQLHAVLNQPLAIVLDSTDQTSSFRIPDMHLQKDFSPNRRSQTWLIPTHAGVYLLQAGNFQSSLIVQTQAEYDDWLKIASLEPLSHPAVSGEKLYGMLGCVNCHSLDGSTRAGPSFKDLWGATVTLEDNSTLLADDKYIEESIRTPKAKVVKGFNPTMPSVFQDLGDNRIKLLLRFIRAQSKFNVGNPNAPLDSPTSQPAAAPVPPTTIP